MSNIYIPYAYYLFHKPTGLKYYGIEYARKSKVANPQNLWTTYFTSSEIVKSLINEYGINSFDVQVRKTFKTREEAIHWERKFLKRINAVLNPEWINGTNGGNEFYNKGGVPHSEKTKKKMSESQKGKFIPQKQRDAVSASNRRRAENGELWCQSPEGRALLSEYVKTGKTGMKGMHHKQSSKDKISKHKTELYAKGLGWNQSEEGKQRAREIAANCPNYGMTNKNHSEESKQLMSILAQGKYDGEKNPMYGKNHSETAKQLMSKARKDTIGIHHPTLKIQKMIRKEELENRISDGWLKGWLPKNKN